MFFAARAGRLAWLIVITCAGFFLLGYGGVLLTGPGHMMALIWPATAFGACMILRQARSQAEDGAMLGAIFLGEFCINVMTHAPLLLNLGFCAIIVVEASAAVIGIRRFASRRLKDLKDTLLFLAFGLVIPPLLGAGLAEGWTALMGDPNWMADGLHWFAANFLGFCIVMPFGLNLSWRQLAKLNLDRRALEAVLTFSALIAVSLFALRYRAHPMPFLILPVALVATVRFRLLGAGLGMILVLGLVFMGDPMTAREIIVMQVFLAVTSIICVRAAMVLNERDLHLAIIESRRRRAVRASRFKSQLLSHVSHEVRGPLAAIINFSALLEKGALPAERAQEFAHIVGHNGELLQRLSDDLMDLARAETGALCITREKILLGPALKTCISAIRLDASLGGKPVVMDVVAEDLSIEADPRRLAQILNNLIANSYKYGDNHSPIRVRASRLGDGFGRIEILNSGPGIPLRERDVLFHPFGQSVGQPAGRDVPGAGLGLSIARMLAEKQGGRLDFESIPGRQTRFWIDLPLAA